MIRTWILALVAFTTLGGCASTAVSNNDPLESVNRKVFEFNTVVDDNFAQPVAKAYQDSVPPFVQGGVRHFFGNLSDLWGGINALAQGSGEAGMLNLMRYITNSTFGMAGFLDIASEMGMKRTVTGLNDTLAVYGVPTGPYLMMPLLGPTTARGLTARVGEWRVGPIASPLQTVDGTRSRIGLTALEVVDQRARLLRLTSQLGGLALDPYSFVRDAYLQRERNKISPQDSQSR